MRLLIAVLFAVTFFGADAFSIQPRIIGGSQAIVDDYPYQVSFYYNNRFSCGGAILSANVVITAAHCTDNRTVSTMYIRAGSSYQGLEETSGKLIKVTKVIQHPKYDISTTTDYDVSLLILEENLNFFFKIQPIELSSKSDEELDGQKGVVTGWGLVNEGGEGPELQLRQITVPLHSQKYCKEIYGDMFTKNMLCAGDLSGGHDTCTGDSGGPLVHDKKLIGIVSWGYGCAAPGKPGLYANVHQFTKWIQENMQ